MAFPGMIAIRSKTLAQTFLPSLDSANGRLCQERLLGSRNIATMVTRPRKAICTMASFYYYDQNPFRFNFHIKIR